jgi:hypothetical protein
MAGGVGTGAGTGKGFSLVRADAISQKKLSLRRVTLSYRRAGCWPGGGDWVLEKLTRKTLGYPGREVGEQEDTAARQSRMSLSH